eukprot:gnl/Trimastix_PCT/5098.p2 GENE.gnl/Trimastix_PCT/5098~~gnl/Trimastix_PCT/5098.p2  ORF type:complete len:122 (+),score=5.05 gnl/Trimastix_PCT/5098:556-921(+)
MKILLLIALMGLVMANSRDPRYEDEEMWVDPLYAYDDFDDWADSVNYPLGLGSWANVLHPEPRRIGGCLLDPVSVVMRNFEASMRAKQSRAASLTKPGRPLIADDLEGDAFWYDDSYWSPY